MRVVVGVFFLLASLAQAEPGAVCARNYVTADGPSACDTGSERYAWVDSAEEGTERVCVILYALPFCSLKGDDFALVPTQSGEQVCVKDYNQPEVVNFCETNPDLYAYVVESD